MALSNKLANSSTLSNDSEINAFLASCNISTAPALGVVTIGMLKDKASSNTVGSASEKEGKAYTLARFK